MEINLKNLFSKLDKTCFGTVNSGLGLALSRTNYDFQIEHWLVKLVEDTDNDLHRIFRQFEINPDRIQAALAKSLDRLKTGGSRTPSIDPEIQAAIKNAWLVSTIEYGYEKIRSGVLLLAMLSDSASKRRLYDIAGDFEKINVDDLKRQLPKIVEGSSEDSEVLVSTPGAAGGAPGGAPGIKAGGKTPALDQFTIDLTARAKAGKIDPVLGRDGEIRQVIDILTRRRQNNPILTGEAGVGKTAVVEGFAIRIAEGDVPTVLQNVSLRTLDLGLLQAGAGVKGEFENRLKTVIEEVKSSPTPIILFIDEAHTMIGAGGSEGQGDAANLLKPALARGELRTVAATTWAEYKKYFEKDAALARRFQVVKVEEPSEPAAIQMMRGIVDMLETHHGVTILEEAVDASVRLSARYIQGRQLPDKSVSLLDTACARVNLGFSSVPGQVEDARRQITGFETELRILKAEEATGSNHAERIGEVTQHLEETQGMLAGLEERWNKEKELVSQIRELRDKLETHAGKKQGKQGAAPTEPLTDEQVAECKTQLQTVSGELKALQGEHPLVQPFVDGQTVAEVVGSWTGIPVGRMVADQIQTVLNIRQLLCERVVGQDHAMEAISKRIQTSRAKLDDPVKPIGVFLLVGPSGVGKTETALALAELMYGGEQNVVTINMSEFKDKSSVSGLIGTTAGYVGYGEGGRLTNAVRRKPYSVVLLDEVEKADKSVHEVFFQVFDKGVLVDGEGRPVDFRNTIILMTSNVATDQIVSLCADPETRPDPDGLAHAIYPELEKVYPPALLGRLVVCPYYPIADEVMKMIIRLKLKKIVKRVRENHGVAFEYDDLLVDEVASRCVEVSSGARNVDNILTNSMLPEMSREFLSRMASGEVIESIKVGVGSDGDFTYTFA